MAIHRSAFPESAWTKLGRRVVEEYYLWHLLGSHPLVWAIGAFVDHKCVGFCISGVFSASTSGFLSKNRNLLIAHLALKPWLIFDPVFFEKLRSGKNLLKRFKAKNRVPIDNVPARVVDSFGILAIAVAPSSQGLGIGQILMNDAENAAINHDFGKMDLTVNPSNLGAIRFYENLGWVRRFENHTWKGTMVKEIGPGRESLLKSD